MVTTKLIQIDQGFLSIFFPQKNPPITNPMNMLKWHNLLVDPSENAQNLEKSSGLMVSDTSTSAQFRRISAPGRTTRPGAVLIRAACEESSTPKRMGRQMKFVSVPRWKRCLAGALRVPRVATVEGLIGS